MLKPFFVSLTMVATLFCSTRELQIENEFVRVWKTHIPPNETLDYHRHDAYLVLVALKGGTLKRIEDTGEFSYLRMEAGKAYWLAPDLVGTLHAHLNEGEEEIVLMVTELKTINDPGDGYGIDFNPPALK